MRDHHPTLILAEDVKFAVDEAAIGPAEIGERLLPPDVVDVRHGPFRERLCLLRRARIHDAAHGEHAETDHRDAP